MVLYKAKGGFQLNMRITNVPVSFHICKVVAKNHELFSLQSI